MLIFNWDDDLDLGIELIDQQHKQIISKANTFFISYKAGHPSQRLQDCLSFLEQYVLYHFQAEEAFQVECGYPEYRSHQAQHSMLKMQFKFHATQLNAAAFSGERVDAFYGFLREWIIGHILSEDKSFASYYRKQAL